MMLGTCAQRGSSETAARQRGQQRFVVGEDEQGKENDQVFDHWLSGNVLLLFSAQNFQIGFLQPVCGQVSPANNLEKEEEEVTQPNQHI